MQNDDNMVIETNTNRRILASSEVIGLEEGFKHFENYSKSATDVFKSLIESLNSKES
ncbi:MAG: hypothetical protein MHPSP_003384, partial [Paramarteilia canceri]